MRYADRMSQLGTETAFEVLAKARALEAKGRSVVHLNREPDFDTPPQSAPPPSCPGRGFTLWPPPSSPNARGVAAISPAIGPPVTAVSVIPRGKPVLTSPSSPRESGD